MKRQFIIFLFLISFLTSCSQFYRLKKEDYKWMPYSGHETLVFRSNRGDTDTIFLLKKDTLVAYPEAQSLNGIEYEIVSVFCKHSDSNMPDDKHRYLENNFVELKKAKDNRAEIVIDLSAIDAEFYRLNSIKIDSLDKEKTSRLQTKIDQFNDVYVIDGEDYLGNFHQRSNFITKVYWSKSQGLIRYDKKDGVYWELEKRY